MVGPKHRDTRIGKKKKVYFLEKVSAGEQVVTSDCTEWSHQVTGEVAGDTGRTGEGADVEG